MIGAVFAGRFILNGLLGDGALFVLYSAKDKVSGKDLSLRVLKQPFDQEEGFVSALTQAVKKGAGIQSPNVERLYEVKQEQGQVFIAGDLTRAPSLADRIRKLAPFTSPVAVSAGIGIVRGLDAFHRAGLVHGDVSAENVAMLADGETRLQMGGIWEAYSAGRTTGGAVLPSLAAYLAPEVSSGAMPTASSDIYAGGILLYELLTGRKPYLAETAMATAVRHATEPTPRVRAVNPSVSVVLDEIVHKAMCKDVTGRYAHASELLFDLRQVQDALRFGRTLSWPIRGQTAAAAPKTPAQQPVAPRMSAVREVPSPREQERAKPERDVPLWLISFFMICMGAVAAVGFMWFYTGSTKPRTETVPNLARLTVSEARADLAQRHLKIRLEDTVQNEYFKVDQIVSSSPPAFTKVPENSFVGVTISAGSKQVSVPDLHAYLPDKARTVLETQGLRLDSQILPGSDPSVGQGAISKQAPEKGQMVDRLTTVQVTVNSGASNVAQPSGSHPGKYRFELEVKLDKLTEQRQVRIDMVDEKGPHTVYNEPGNPGDVIRQPYFSNDKEATFRIYYDGVLVREVEPDTTGLSQ